MTIVNSTFAGNQQAISNTNGTVSADFCTFSQNGSATISTYNNTIFETFTRLRADVFVGNQNCTFPFPPFRYIDGGYNIANDNTCPFAGTSLNNTDPMLGALTDNGGPTQTISPADTSLALAFVPSAECGPDFPALTLLREDQRGYGRPAPSHRADCSAGALEFGAVRGVRMKGR